MKVLLLGDNDSEPKKENIEKLCDGLLETDLLVALLDAMPLLEFESRRDIGHVYNFVLRTRKDEAVAYIKKHDRILTTLVNGYVDTEIALNCGAILREILRNEDICVMLLNSTLFENFF